MPLLIDGYNLLHISGILGRGVGPGGLQRSRLALLNFLAESLTARELARTTVVFDANDAPPGLPRNVNHRGINVWFAVEYASADDLLEELISADHAPSRLTVVSSDHRIQRAARRRRAKAVDSDVWYAALQGKRRQRRLLDSVTPARPPVPLLEEDINYWIRQFGGESVLMSFLEHESAAIASPAESQASDLESSISEEPASGEAAVTSPGRQGPKISKKAEPRKRSRRSDATAGKPRRRIKTSEPEKPRAPGFESLDNPFPPGYGDDLLGEI